MTNEFYITAGIPPIDNGNESGVNKFYITAGLVPDDTAVGGVAPTSTILGPLWGPLAGPIG